VDLLATMAGCLGVSLPENAAEDSVSNLSLWKNPGGNPVRQETVHQSIDGSLSIRRENWKLELCPGSGGWSAPKPGEESQEAPRFQLYNLETDRGERNNLIREYPDLAMELRKRLKEIVEQGRSTPGNPQQNNGGALWDAIKWLEEKL
jgi:arylsulfatase A-like enzyme